MSGEPPGMSLRLPSEIVVESFLPTVRVQLARRLADHGLTQEAIADHLGVTQAAVSTYLQGDASVEPRFRDDPRLERTVERLADGLAAGDMTEYEALGELLALVREFEDRGPICQLHEEAVPALEGLGCDLCVRGMDTELVAEREVLTNVRQAARILAGTPGMATYIPNVGTNLGTALPDATGVTDVAAIPGRVYALGDRVEIPANPEFGASRHVATAVLAAMAADPSVRGAVNVATRDELLATARDRGLECLEFDASYEDRAARLRERFESDGLPTVAYHEGAFGIEPVAYVFGETAVEAAELVAALVSDASA